MSSLSLVAFPISTRSFYYQYHVNKLFRAWYFFLLLCVRWTHWARLARYTRTGSCSASPLRKTGEHEKNRTGGHPVSCLWLCFSFCCLLRAKGELDNCLTTVHVSQNVETRLIFFCSSEQLTARREMPQRISRVASSQFDYLPTSFVPVTSKVLRLPFVLVRFSRGNGKRDTCCRTVRYCWKINV